MVPLKINKSLFGFYYASLAASGSKWRLGRWWVTDYVARRVPIGEVARFGGGKVERAHPALQQGLVEQPLQG